LERNRCPLQRTRLLTITIRGIPLAAYDYIVNGKSALEWIMERYQVTTNKDSLIVNDPNLWLSESGNSRYIIDLILKVTTVSMKTLEIVNKISDIPLDFESQKPLTTLK
jgi:predicted helicase